MFLARWMWRVPNSTPNRISVAQKISAMAFGGTSLLRMRNDSVTPGSAARCTQRTDQHEQRDQHAALAR